MELTDKTEDNVKANDIILKLREVHNMTQSSLRELRVPENLVQLNTTFIPNFDKLLPDDVTTLFRDIKELTIMYYNAHGFSQREISRRLGGLSTIAVSKTLKEKKNGKK